MATAPPPPCSTPPSTPAPIRSRASSAACPRRFFALRRRIIAAAPDLLLTYNWGAIEWALANSLFGLCRHIHFEDGFGPEETDKRLWRRSMLRRLALMRTSTIVVPSRNLEGIAQREWHLPTTRLRYIPNGIDADAFAAHATTRRSSHAAPMK